MKGAGQWQLFWERQLVGEWLDDRVLSVSKHAAPVLRLARGLAEGGELLLSGYRSNKRGQPVIVDWFAVPFVAGEQRAVRPQTTCLTRPASERVQRT
jgi:hypothetical protein